MADGAGDLVLHTEHTSDGRSVETFASGKSRTTFADGCEIDVLPSGLKVQRNTNGTVIETDSARGTELTTKSDGVSVKRFAAGNTVQTMMDGTKIAVRASGVTTQTDPDGTRIVTLPGGARTDYMVSGITIETLSADDVELCGVRKVQTNLNGVLVLTYTDGARVQYDARTGVTIETKASGSVLERQADGAWLRTEDGWDSAVLSYDDVVAEATLGQLKLDAERAHAGLAPLVPFSNLLRDASAAVEDLEHDAGEEGAVALRSEETTSTGTLIATYEDGRVVETKASGVVITIFPDARTVQKMVDGVVIETFGIAAAPVLQSDPDGTRVVTYPSGRSVTHLPSGVEIEVTPSAKVGSSFLLFARLHFFGCS